MTASATSPITSAAQAAPTAASNAGRARLAENFDMFLTLLTTQLKNQDPTAPMDSNQFMSQLVQMTSVEQQLAGNDLLKQLVANTGTNLGSVVSLIGKEIRAATDEAKLTGGQARWGYTLASPAADVKLEILDASGLPVRTIAADAEGRKGGDHAFVWDGKDGAGHNMPEGVYRLRVTAADAANKTIKSSNFVQGLVTGLEQQDGQGLITVNGAKVALGLVTSVALPAAGGAPAGSDSNSGSGSATAGDPAGADPDTHPPADQTSA